MISTGAKIAIVVGILMSIFAIMLAFFYFYRRQKIRKSRKQKAEIQKRDDELQAFRDSVVGMRTVEKNYIPFVPNAASLSSSFAAAAKPSESVPKVQWCWKETSAFLSRHPTERIVGDPADCWIKYDDDVSYQIEAAYTMRHYATSDFSPLPGYTIDFASMKQVKTATGFERDVKRHIQPLSSPTPNPTVDLSDTRVCG